MQTVQSSLTYKIAPYDEADKRPFPTLILLHGRGANEDDLLALVPYLAPQFLIIAVRAPFPFVYGGATWYETLASGTPQPEQFTESYGRLVEFVRDMKEHYPVDHGRLFFLGFSMGAVMSYAFALTRPQEVKGVVAHSGYIPENTPLVFDWRETKGKEFFVGHGTLDPVVGIQFGRRAKELLEKNEASVVYREYPIQHSMSEESVSDFSLWLGRKILKAPR